MQPSSDRPTSGGSSRAMRRYGPIAVIVVVVAVIGAIVLVSGGGDDTDDATDDTVAAEDVGEGALSFSAAEEQGIEVDWPDTCDTERGTVAIPNYFAAECYAPFEGDNGGATDTGVTEDTITIAYYQSPPNPISDFILGGFGITDTNEQACETIAGLRRHVQRVLRDLRPHPWRWSTSRARARPTTTWPPGPTPCASTRRSGPSWSGAGRS